METLEHGVFAVDADSRTIRGLLIPWGVKSRTSKSKTKPIIFDRGSIKYPADPSVVGLNRQHDRFDPIGRGAEFEDTEAGLVAVFAIARTDEGDAWLSDHGDLVKLSAELRDIVRTGEFGEAKLTGAALVDEPAFEGAGLFSLDPDGDEEPEEDEPDEDEPDQDEPDDEPDEEEEETVADATAPDTMLGSRRKPAAPELSKAGLFGAMIRHRQTGDLTALKPYLDTMVGEDGTGLFAIADVKYDGTGGLAADAKIPNQWLGELWAGRRFNRTVVPLLTQGTLAGVAIDAWTWTTKPEVQTWTGNKSAVPSTPAPAVGPKQFFAQRFAGVYDLAREYYDFNRTDVITSFIEAMVDSYAIKSDGYAVTQLVAGATAFTPGAATSNKGLTAIFDGALAVLAAGATPSFAVVHPSVLRDIALTPHSSALEYLNAAVGLEGGSTNGFQIIPDSRLAAGQIVVGAREAATAWELGGSPIRVSALDMVKGGVDEAVFGYIAVGVTYPAAVVKATITLP